MGRKAWKMDMVSMWPVMWPVLLAGLVGCAGLIGAWWYSRHRAEAAGRSARQGRSASSQKNAPKAKPAAAAKARFGRKASDNKEALDTLADWEPIATRVLTTGEREAYHVLRKALPEHMILAQVPVARFIKVPTDNPYSEWLRRVGSLCADLVVCDMASQVVAVVEIRQPMSREKERSHSL
jgi:hypothetical protein